MICSVDVECALPYQLLCPFFGFERAFDWVGWKKMAG